MSSSPIELAVKAKGYQAVLDSFTPEQWHILKYNWAAWARPEQLPPSGSWLVWLLLAGRGFGKSRTIAEWGRAQAQAMPGSHGAIVAATAADVRDVLVKAIIACTPPEEGLVYEPSKRSLSWKNGTTATLYSAEEPDRLRGPQHHWALVDELAAWMYAEETWDMLAMTMRLGSHPRIAVATTPRPIPIVRRLLADSGTAVTRGSTFDNTVNLSETFVKAVRERYEGTRLGRQELFAEVLDDVPGALWTHSVIDKARKTVAPDMARVVVAVDPSGGDGEGNDEQGIMVVGLGVDGECYVLADMTCKLSPEGWGRRAVNAYLEYKADRIVYENNFGGQMVEHVIKTAAKNMDARVFTREVKASRGKVVRAEPCAALYEQGRVHHVGHDFQKLEDQMCVFTPTGEFDTSPDRVDALVWGMTELMFKERVTLGSAPVLSGTRRGNEVDPDEDDDDDH